MNKETEILSAIAEHLGLSVEDIDRRALLQEELNLGPIEINDLLSFLSQKFGVAFEPDEVENIKRIDDLIVMIEDNLLE